MPPEERKAMWLLRNGDPRSKANIGAHILPRVIGYYVPGTFILQGILRRMIGSLIRCQKRSENPTWTPQELAAW